MNHLNAACASACAAIDADLCTLASHASDPLREVVHAALHGGKRARGILLVAAAEGCGLLTTAVVRAAANVEMLHAATLVQDDIFDRSNMRRGRPAVHCTYGEQHAVLASDWMLTESIRAAYRLDVEFGEALTDCAQQMMAGEAREAESCESSAIAARRKHALAVAHGKTGALFGLALGAPALLAGDTARAVRLLAYGSDLGVAFQYLDDALDLYGDEAAAGKGLARDLPARLCTLPMLDALPFLPPAVASSLAQGMSPESMGRAMAALHAAPVRGRVMQLAHERWHLAAQAVAGELACGGRVLSILNELAYAMLPADAALPVFSAA